MKYLYAILVSLVLSTSVAAEELDLSFSKQPDGSVKIVYDEDKWVKVTSAADYDVLVAKELIGNKKEKVHKFIGLTSFYKDSSFPTIQAPVRKIYSYGILNCKDSSLYLLGDFFIDAQDTIVYSQKHEFGTYITDMSVPNSVRNDIYNVVCKESI